MINSSALVASPRPPRSCHCDAPVFDAPTPPLEESKDTTNAGRFSWLSAAFRSPNNSSAARAKMVNSSALAASRRTQRSSLFDAPLFVAPTPPLHHPMSTASVRLLNKTRSLPISDRQKSNFTRLLINPFSFCLVPSIKKQAWLGPEDFPQVPSLTTVTFTRSLPQVHATGEEVPPPPSLPFSPPNPDFAWFQAPCHLFQLAPVSRQRRHDRQFRAHHSRSHVLRLVVAFPHVHAVTVRCPPSPSLDLLRGEAFVPHR